MGGRAGSGLFFPTRFGFRALIFGPVRFGQKMFLFGSPSGQNYFYSGQFRVQSLKGDLIFLGLIIQEIKFLVGFSRVCPHFPAFLLSSGCSGQKYITSGYLRFSKKWPGSVRVFKNTRTAGQISGRVWTRPSPNSLHLALCCWTNLNQGVVIPEEWVCLGPNFFPLKVTLANNKTSYVKIL